jgi:hypothetical protein
MVKLRRHTIRILFAIIFSGTTTYACICKAPSQQNAFRKASAVFTGQVIEINLRENMAITDPSEALHPYAVRFKVERYWKGVTTSEVTVLSDQGTLPCYLGTLQRGKRYLVYAYGNSLLVSTSCSRTVPIDQASKDLKKLGKGKIAYFKGASTSTYSIAKFRGPNKTFRESDSQFPQNSTRTPLSASEVDILRNDTQTLLNKKACSDFISAVLAEAKRITGMSNFETTDAMVVFKGVANNSNSNGGFSRGPLTRALAVGGYGLTYGAAITIDPQYPIFS